MMNIVLLLVLGGIQMAMATEPPPRRLGSFTRIEAMRSADLNFCNEFLPGAPNGRPAALPFHLDSDPFAKQNDCITQVGTSAWACCVLGVTAQNASARVTQRINAAGAVRSTTLGAACSSLRRPQAAFLEHLETIRPARRKAALDQKIAESCAAPAPRTNGAPAAR